MMKHKQTRRSFFSSLAGVTAATMFGSISSLMASERDKVKITDIKTMIFKGPGVNMDLEETIL